MKLVNPVANGWFPYINVLDDTIYITHGVNDCLLSKFSFNPSNGDIAYISTTSLPVTPGETPYGCSFLSPDVVIYWSFIGDLWSRYTYNILTGSLTKITGPNIETGGNRIFARDNVFVEVKGRTNGFQFYINGQFIKFPAGVLADTRDGFVVHASDPDISTLTLRSLDGQILDTIIPLVGAHQVAAGLFGSFIYGGYGPVFGYNRITRISERLNVTDWASEGIGCTWDDEIATVFWYDDANLNGMFIRKWGSKEAIILDTIGIHIDAISVGNFYILASCNDIGIMTLESVPTNAQRRIPIKPQFDSPMDYPSVIKPIWRGCIGGAENHPGNFGGGNDTTRPIVEGFKAHNAESWTLPNLKSHILVNYHSPKDSQVPLLEEAECIKQAFETGKTFGYYDDNPIFTDAAVKRCRELRALGLGVLPIVNCYPLGANDNIEAFETRVMASLDKLDIAEFDMVGLERPLYTASGAWPKQLVADVNKRITRYCNEEPEVVLDGSFGWDRPPIVPWIQRYWTGLVNRTESNATKLPQLPKSIKVVPVPIPPTPTPIPKPIPPAPKRKGFWEKLLEALFGRKK